MGFGSIMLNEFRYVINIYLKINCDLQFAYNVEFLMHGDTDGHYTGHKKMFQLDEKNCAITFH